MQMIVKRSDEENAAVTRRQTEPAAGSPTPSLSKLHRHGTQNGTETGEEQNHAGDRTLIQWLKTAIPLELIVG
jgi:hypothetical protein